MTSQKEMCLSGAGQGVLIRSALSIEPRPLSAIRPPDGVFSRDPHESLTLREHGDVDRSSDGLLLRYRHARPKFGEVDECLGHRRKIVPRQCRYCRHEWLCIFLLDFVFHSFPEIVFGLLDPPARPLAVSFGDLSRQAASNSLHKVIF